MHFFQKLKDKKRDGSLKEMWQELCWVWQYMRRYRLVIVVNIGLGILATLMGLAGAVASKVLIDAVVGCQSDEIFLAAVLTGTMMLSNIVLQGVSSRVSAVISVKVQNEIQAEIYDRILSTDWESVQKFRSGDLLNRLNADSNTISGGVTGFAPSLATCVVQFFGTLAIIVYFDPTMALISLCSVPVAGIISRVLFRRMRNYNKDMKRISSDMMAFGEDSFQNLTSIKSFGITSQFSQKMRILQMAYRGAFLDYNKLTVQTVIFLSVIGLMVSGSCFGWGVYRLWKGAISYGTMVLFLQLSSTLTASFSSLIGLAPRLISIATSAGRVMEILALPREETDATQKMDRNEKYTLELEGISFAYQTGEAVLEHVDLVVHPGELVSITGPSGVGKTTILRVLLCLVLPQQGTVYLQPAHGPRQQMTPAGRTLFSYVPQGNTIFSGTIAENLRMVKQNATEADLWQALEIACAAEFVRSLPDGLHSTVGEHGAGLSEGQAQRISIARAIVCDAPILLLDEATSALDEETERRLLQNLMHSGKEKTCIVITHRTSILQYCDRNYHMEGTRLHVCDGVGYGQK